MDKRICLISFISLLIVVAACSDYDLSETVEQGEAMDLRAEIEQQYTTRASDGGFADLDEIGVFIVNYTDDGQAVDLKPTGNHADNVRFTYDEASGKWTGSYQLYWKDKKTPVDAYGYYPFDAELANTAAYPFSVQTNQRDPMKTGRKLSGYEQSDFLWAKREGVIPTAGAITLRHHHLMAGIKVQLTEGEGFEAGEWEDIQKTVLVEGTITESTINLQTGIVSCVGDAAKTIIPQLHADEYRAVVVPQTISAQLPLFSFTIDNKTYRFTREEEMVYYPGKLHQFTFDVQKSLETGDYLFTLISESVTPWDNDPLSHDGSAREYITVHIEEGEYIGDVVERMGLDPKEIVNLKLTGTMSGMGGWQSSPQFDYIREHFINLEAINMKELRTKEMKHLYWEGGWGEIPYDRHEFEDDFIPMNAFVDLKTLNYVVWPDSLKGIADGAFGGTNLRGSLILPEGLRLIGGSAFSMYGRQALSFTGELYIPSTVEYIGDGAFGNPDSKNYCFFQSELVLPERMKYLGSGAFAGCPYLTGQIHIPEGLDVLNHSSFAPNMTAKVVRIPQGIKKVYGMGGQPASIIIPEGVEEIGGFKGCSSLRGDILLPSTLRVLQGAAFEGTSISHINLPEGLEIIDEFTFYNCAYLQDTITIPSSVIQINHNAFEGCTKLNAVILPEHLEEIKNDAFGNCRSLSYVRCLNPVPPILDGSAFNGIEKNECALVVPEGSVDAYRNAEGWREFKRISAYQNFVCRPMQAKLLNKSNIRTIVLNSDGNWKVTSCPSWIHPSKTSGYKKTEMTVTIDALAHGSPDREGSIVFTLTDKKDENGNAITCDYQVKQFDYEHDEDNQVNLQKATKGKGINIVFVGDGYDAEDIARGRFLEDMKEGAEYFFAVEPYKTYKDYFNVYADMAMSYESGVCSNVNIWRQTKFSTTYGAGKDGRLGVYAEDVFNYVLNEVPGSAITGKNVNESLIICVPNDDAYEGVTILYDSGAAVAFAPHSRYDYPNDYRGLIQHEAGGHGFGKLGDEYIYHRDNILTCPCTCCTHAADVIGYKALGWFRNISLEGRYKMVDWSHLIFDPRYGDIVDIYEGAHMHGRGIYRSEENSCMNNNVPYYSTISRQAIVERIKQYAGETFDFEQFVANDSREMGEKFLTRSTNKGSIPPAMHNPIPIIKKGSPLDYLKKKGGKK